MAGRASGRRPPRASKESPEPRFTPEEAERLAPLIDAQIAELNRRADEGIRLLTEEYEAESAARRYIYTEKMNVLPDCLLDMPWTEFESKYNSDWFAVFSAQPDPLSAINEMGRKVELLASRLEKKKEEEERALKSAASKDAVTAPEVEEERKGDEVLEAGPKRVCIEEADIDQRSSAVAEEEKENVESTPSAPPRAATARGKNTARRGRKAKQPAVEASVDLAVTTKNATPGSMPFQLRSNMCTPVTSMPAFTPGGDATAQLQERGTNARVIPQHFMHADVVTPIPALPQLESTTGVATRRKTRAQLKAEQAAAPGLFSATPAQTFIPVIEQAPYAKLKIEGKDGFYLFLPKDREKDADEVVEKWYKEDHNGKV